MSVIAINYKETDSFLTKINNSIDQIILNCDKCISYMEDKKKNIMNEEVLVKIGKSLNSLRKIKKEFKNNFDGITFDIKNVDYKLYRELEELVELQINDIVS